MYELSKNITLTIEELQWSWL